VSATPLKVRFPRLFQVSSQKEVKIQNLLPSSTVQHILSIPLLLEEQEDMSIWDEEMHGN